MKNKKDMRHKIQTGEFNPVKVETPKNQRLTWSDEELVEKGIKQGQIQGIAYMAAMYLRYYGEHPAIKEAWNAWSCTVQECRDNDVAEFDQEILDKYENYLDN